MTIRQAPRGGLFIVTINVNGKPLTVFDRDRVVAIGRALQLVAV